MTSFTQISLILLLTFCSIESLAQPTTNKPPEKSPFNEDSQNNQQSYSSDGKNAITIEPTLILRGIIGFNYLHKLEKYPAFYKVGLGKSFGEDQVAEDHDYETEGLGFSEVEYLIATDQYNLKTFQSGLGYYLFQDPDDLIGMGVMLMYNYGRLNVPTLAFETPIRGVEKVKYRTHMFGATYFLNFTRSSDSPFFLTALNIGVSLNRYAINESKLVDDFIPYYSMSKKMTSASYPFILLSIQFGCGW